MDNVESTKEEWETPRMEALVVEQTAHQPGSGLDGDFFPDCSHS